MKGEALEKILDLLEGQAALTADILDVFFSGYGESYRKLRNPARFDRRLETTKSIKSLPIKKNHKNKQSFYSLLYKLKKEGIIDKKRSSRGTVWRITEKGLEKLGQIKEKSLFWKRKAHYKKEKGKKIKVIIFDVPEKERHKREWLRYALQEMGFNFLQGSVWIGNGKIPENFLYDLKERKMVSYVHIFEIFKGGTIKQREFVRKNRKKILEC